MMQLGPAQLANNGSYIGALHKEISHAEEGRFLTHVHDASEHYTLSQPRFPVTAVRVCMGHSGEGPGLPPCADMLGICTLAALLKVFGELPRLPAGHVQTGNIFSYCLHSDAMRMQLRNALMLSGLGITIDPLLKAAVMEDMYVF